VLITIKHPAEPEARKVTSRQLAVNSQITARARVISAGAGAFENEKAAPHLKAAFQESFDLSDS